MNTDIKFKNLQINICQSENYMIYKTV